MSRKYIFVCGAHFTCIFGIALILGNVLPWVSLCYYKNVFDSMVWTIIAYQTLRYTKKRYLNERIRSENKAVVISGCDSGFGHLLAKRLCSKGFHVFAGCLFPKGPGAEELQKACSSQHLQIMAMDVTNDESVKLAAEFVKQNLGDCELWAVVNNAGILKSLSVELAPVQDFLDCHEVNAIGGVRVAKAFLPMIRSFKGRIVNMNSIVSTFSIPYCAPYCMSKYAALSFTECLRREMDVWGVRVISIEPDFYQTRLTDSTISDKQADVAFASLSEDTKADYGEEFLKSYKEKRNVTLYLNSADLNRVVDDLDSAITLEYPDIVYKPRTSIFTCIGGYILVSLSDYLRDVFFKFTLRIFLRLRKPDAVNQKSRLLIK